MRRALALIALLATGGRAIGQARYPVQGMTPPQEGGGFVSIPGAPLPNVPADSVRTAIQLYEPGLALLRIVGETKKLARGYGYLATLYAAIGDFPKSLTLFDQAQRILEKQDAAAYDLAWVHNNRGLVKLRAGRYADGLKSFRAAIALIDSSRKNLLEPRLIALENLASAYSLLGELESSEGAYLNVLETLRQMGKEGSRAHKVTRGNLAVLYSGMGDYPSAKKMLDRLLAERGLTHDVRFQALNNLGYVLSNLKQFQEAEARLMEARALSRDGSRERALVLMNLTAMYTFAQNFERAEASGQAALQLVGRLHGAESRQAAAIMANLAVASMGRGDLAKADRLLTEACATLAKEPGDQDAFIFATRGLALVAQRRGQQARALELSRQALHLAKQSLERILAFGSEAQRLAYRNHASPYDQLANLGDPALLADAVLAMKGVVLDSLLAERALARKSRAPADRERLDRVSGLKVAIMEKISRGDGDLDALERALKHEETALAKKLAPRLRRPQSRVTLAGVQARLEDKQVLIEIIRYERYLDGGKLVSSYGGIVIPPQGRPRWVPLGQAEAIEASIENLVSRVGPVAGTRSADPLGRDADVTGILRDLEKRLWKPLAAALPAGTRKILLSPDGATSFVPWATLLDANGRFLAERWQLTQIGSGRDLLRDVPAPPRQNTLLALADGGGDLPFSRVEVRAVEKTAQARGWRTTILIGKGATERELFHRPRPRILHLATHAGQLRGDVYRLSRNPMYRGYLLLGGGEATLAAWRAGFSAPVTGDGVVTAEEASGLDLSETWLTVLSACETGAGDVRAGEGVIGLRRGFALAGTQNLLFSLWRVEDDATSDFMKAFYGRLFRTGDPARAFHETQVAELRRWREDDGVRAALRRAGGFVLTR